jgi:hypothetical protein
MGVFMKARANFSHKNVILLPKTAQGRNRQKITENGLGPKEGPKWLVTNRDDN